MAPMTCTDYFGFASLFVLLIGSVNWGVVAIRYAVGDGLYNITEIGSGEELADLYRSKYNEYPTPDLLELLGATAGMQMLVYWIVFASGLFHLGLFIYNSVELKDESKD